MGMYLRSWLSGTQCEMYARLEDVFLLATRCVVLGTRAETCECKCLNASFGSWIKRSIFTSFMLVLHANVYRVARTKHCYNLLEFTYQLNNWFLRTAYHT